MLSVGATVQIFAAIAIVIAKYCIHWLNEHQNYLNNTALHF